MSISKRKRTFDLVSETRHVLHATPFEEKSRVPKYRVEVEVDLGAQNMLYSTLDWNDVQPGGAE